MENATHTFSIAQMDNPITPGQPFGDKYAGSFTVRRPTLGDKRRIEVKDAAAMSAFGDVSPRQISEGTRLISWVFSTVSTIGEERPDWFDQEKLYSEDDEAAVLAVWSEVADWLARFRRSADSQKGS